MPSMKMVLCCGLKTAASCPWNRTAMSLAQSLLTETSGVVTSLNKWASLALSGRCGSLNESVATEVINSSFATWATIAVASVTGEYLVPLKDAGKQLAVAAESSAAE